MIDLNDFIIYETPRKISRYNGEMNRVKKYRCFCEKCKKDKGYQSAYRYQKKPMCVKCATTTQKHKINLKNNHWSKRGMTPWNKDTTTTEQKLKNRLRGNLRSRLNKALKGNYKSGSAVKDLGCSMEEFKVYLENKFTSKMTWDNYGRKGWHIDHIQPLAKFNLQSSKEFKKVCHYTNLQPLWWKDNLSKGSD